MTNKIINLKKYKNSSWKRIFRYCQGDLVLFLDLCRSNYELSLFKRWVGETNKDDFKGKKGFQRFNLLGIKMFDEIRGGSNE
tara:strand:+ start:90 stop:335 length:246 start_codon:yes stop_codon:yes gene_type:complete